MIASQLVLSKLDIFLVFYLCYSDCLDLDLDVAPYVAVVMSGKVSNHVGLGSHRCAG